MGDFAQAGLICTLQRLNETHLGALERELMVLARERRIGLILPCHARELGQPALAHLCEELKGASWVSEIVVSMNGLGGAPEEAAARRFFARLPQRTRVLWNDAPARVPIYTRLLGKAPPPGKGLNVWAAIGLLHEADFVVTQDCDVTTFRREGLARLSHACVHPELNFALAKMYYPRVTDRLYGRVSRLFLGPLLQAALRLAGHRPLLDFLLSFRYPLAGEMALRRSLAEQLTLDPGWGLELSALCECFRHVDPREVCQVDGGSEYDHKHQPADEALPGMARALARTLLAELGQEGIALDPAALEQAFRRESADALRRYAALARSNALPFAAGEEAALSEAFARCVHPSDGAAPLPSWQSLLRTAPAEVAAFRACAGSC